MIIESAEVMEQLGTDYAKKLQGGMTIFLKGELGAGKTTFVRGLLRSLGVKGTVKSPTYTLVESYELEHFVIHHFDLYRLTSPYELEEMGFRDYSQNNSVVLIEWPEKADLPAPSAEIQILYHDLGREVTFNENT